MAKEHKNSFFGGAAVLAAAIGVVKLIGALFKIPIVRILTEEAYADFSNAYNIYAVLLTVATAGLPVALSKLVAANHAVGQERQVHRIFRVALATFFTLGFSSFLLMFFGNHFLAELLHDSMAAQAIRFLSPAVVCVSCLSAFRGFAQGHSYMVPSAVSQVIEAAVKLLVGLPLAYLAVKAGKADDVCAAVAILGVTIGEMLALIYMIVNYARTRPPLTGPPATLSNGRSLRDLLAIAVPITLTASSTSIIILIDSSVVQGRLQNALGMEEAASRALYGTYAGVLNIYNLPASFIIAVTASVIPAVSAALAQHERRAASRVVRAALHVTALLVFPMGVGISVLAQPIVKLLFDPRDPALSGALLSVLGIAAIFVCLSAVCNSVLQAYGYQHLPLFVMIGAGVVMLIIDFILVGIPAVNILGSPIGTLCCFALATAIDLLIIRRVVPNPPHYPRVFFGPALATLIMGVSVWVVYRLASLFTGNLISTAAAILVGVAVYVFLVIFLRLLNREELKLMPKGDKIADLLRLP